ncbi:MAG: 30S ribosomal protein S13 [Desulfurococcaceae archaeon]|uniref:Small ribosomal subunit protein uS13 n=1 Tax=Staphylothermus marinus TaxID=2280 RepID=A0A7C4NP30_STAMA
MFRVFRGDVLSSRSFKYIVRVAATDINGELSTLYGLAEIKGIGVNFANAICRVLNIDPNMKIGYLTEEEISRVEDVIKNPGKYGIPHWLFNRRKDFETGENMHLVGSDLIYYVKQDIEREKKIRSWRGYRHALGLKVRGQRTRTTGRTGATVGVRKKKQPGGK